METLQVYSPTPSPQQRVIPAEGFRLTVDPGSKSFGGEHAGKAQGQKGDGSNNEMLEKASRQQSTIFLPPGTVVTAISFVLHRDASLFPFPDSWRSERWLDNDNRPVSADRRRSMEAGTWAFSSGARACVGQHLAIVLLKAVLAGVYAEFETTMVEATVGEGNDYIK